MSETLTSIESCAGELVELGSLRARVQIIGGTPVIIAPEGYRITEFTELRDDPKRVRQSVTLHSLRSLIEYWQRHAVPGASALFADLAAARFVAVLDYHYSEFPGWCRHIATYSCPITPEWKAWKENDGVWMKQIAFAEFLEQNHPDIVTAAEGDPQPLPTAADMLEVARRLEAAKSATWAYGNNLSNGDAELRFVETTTTRAVLASVTVPERFDIGVALFQGGAHFRLRARFAYRIGTEGDLQMRYWLLRPHLTHDEAVIETLNELRAVIPADSIFEGVAHL